MTVEEQYPSTNDCAPILGAQDDPVLLCLERARKRIKRAHSRSEYRTPEGAVCAIGAPIVVDGYTGYIDGDNLMEIIETHLSKEAQEAIDLLNKAALELHPESRQFGQVRWSGPLEWVNQSWEPPGVESVDDDKIARAIKKEILRIYDHTIALRSGELVPA